MSSPPPPPPPGWSPQPGAPWPQQPGPPQGPEMPPAGMPPPGGGYPGPPPPGGPGGYGLPPGMQPPPPPPPRRSNTGAVIAILAGGGFIIIVAIAVLLAVTVFNGGKEKSATERLADSARDLSSARALTLRGSFGTTTTTLQGDLKVSSGGRVSGDVTWDGKQVPMLYADDDLFAKGDQSFWRDKALFYTNTNFLSGGDRWGKLSNSSITTSFKGLTPSAIAARMRSVGKYSVRSSTKTTVQGRSAIRIVTFSGTYVVSADKESKLLRYESTYPSVAADITVQSSDAGSATISGIRSRMGELRESFDPTSRPRLDGKMTFSSCRSGERCTVSAKVWTTRGTRPSVEVTVTFRFTTLKTGGRYLGQCTDRGIVTSLTSVSVSCTVSDSAFQRASKGVRDLWVTPYPVAGGASSSEIQTMQSSLDRE